MMKSLDRFGNSKISFVFTDIDDTLTRDGRLESEAFTALWQLYQSRIAVVPVTGRPAGWCELIARQWPVAGVIGENGGLYFRYHQREMRRHYVFPAEVQERHRQRLLEVKEDILKQVPGAAVASDQFCRQMDLAIDFCEDVNPLPEKDVRKIVEIFEQNGAQAKVSSIHVNGWFGEYDKLSMCRTFMKNEFQKNLNDIQDEICFVGDSPNDEPMFEFFQNAFAVQNVTKFLPQLEYKPRYVATQEGGKGFAQIVDKLLSLRK